MSSEQAFFLDHILHGLNSSVRLSNVPTQASVEAPAAEQVPHTACGIILLAS